VKRGSGFGVEGLKYCSAELSLERAQHHRQVERRPRVTVVGAARLTFSFAFC
jgi:hypothetical protein